MKLFIILVSLLTVSLAIGGESNKDEKFDMPIPGRGKDPVISRDIDEKYEEGFCAGYNLAARNSHRNIDHYRSLLNGSQRNLWALNEGLRIYVKVPPITFEFYFRRGDGTQTDLIRCSKFAKFEGEKK